MEKAPHAGLACWRLFALYFLSTTLDVLAESLDSIAGTQACPEGNDQQHCD